tara:strand:- start:874 stop:1011 length:138 start_codon:yes stop_codon:yes gene_type:complete
VIANFIDYFQIIVAVYLVVIANSNYCLKMVAVVKLKDFGNYTQLA